MASKFAKNPLVREPGQRFAAKREITTATGAALLQLPSPSAPRNLL